ncbi:hypothetical protein CY34DRAFT_112905 [Suillus luteus UH-Slu-Lm8-n1]|uniref:Uncharacterized protein n=1 Tax=Suillus luteus UH-Slu-Lm8-n1 TaxID=930992 RepID=A0A0D0B5Y1_9AGAM|nr:hypothetical protein CY34DRAFT_112905 [Suillus luteus UH-Slu-Lm8-n1]
MLDAQKTRPIFVESTTIIKDDSRCCSPIGARNHRKGKGRVLVTERSTTARPVIDAFVLVSKGERHTLLCAKQPVRFRRNWFFCSTSWNVTSTKQAWLSTTSAICFRRPQRQNLFPRNNHVCNISSLSSSPKPLQVNDCLVSSRSCNTAHERLAIARLQCRRFAGCSHKDMVNLRIMIRPTRSVIIHRGG